MDVIYKVYFFLDMKNVLSKNEEIRSLNISIFDKDIFSGEKCVFISVKIYSINFWFFSLYILIILGLLLVSFLFGDIIIKGKHFSNVWVPSLSNIS